MMTTNSENTKQTLMSLRAGFRLAAGVVFALITLAICLYISYVWARPEMQEIWSMQAKEDDQLGAQLRVVLYSLEIFAAGLVLWVGLGILFFFPKRKRRNEH